MEKLEINPLINQTFTCYFKIVGKNGKILNTGLICEYDINNLINLSMKEQLEYFKSEFIKCHKINLVETEIKIISQTDFNELKEVFIKKWSDNDNE